MKILILLGHPNHQSFCGSLADAYQKGAEDAGHQVRRINIGDLDFDSNLHEGYGVIQELEPDLVNAQESITWSEHVVIIYPTWWVSMPAVLKGFFDRAFLPGYAFKYRDDSPWWDQLLKGRSARIVTTMDAPKFYYWLVYFNAGQRQLKYGILRFCGFSPVRSASICGVKDMKREKLESWIKRLEEFGSKGV